MHNLEPHLRGKWELNFAYTFLGVGTVASPKVVRASRRLYLQSPQAICQEKVLETQVEGGLVLTTLLDHQWYHIDLLLMSVLSLQPAVWRAR